MAPRAHIQRVAAASVLLWSVSVVAAPPGWPLEPTTIAGVKLGAPLADSGIPECVGEQGRMQRTTPCIERSSMATGAPIVYLLGTGIGAGFKIEQDPAGNVTSMTLAWEQHSFTELQRMLVVRYGKPTHERVELVQNRMGASFQSTVLQWVGQRVSITAIERAADLSVSQAIFSDNASKERDAARRQEIAKERASKL